MELPSCSQAFNRHLVPSPEFVYNIGTRLNIASNLILGGGCRAEIIEHKRVRWDRTSQVVVLRVIDTKSEALAKGTKLIGKIFDPVYDVSGNQIPGGAVPRVKWLKDNEARVFRHLASLQGSVIPIFYGDSTCQRLSTIDDAEEIDILLFELRTEQPLCKYSVDGFNDQEKDTFREALQSTFRLIHSHNVYHGDPVIENLLYQDGKIIVLDFGVSAIMEQGSSDVEWMIEDDDALVDSVLEVYTVPPVDVPFGHE
jgi:hypothetical protein